MAKNLCKWGKKEVEKDFKTYAEHVKDASYVCIKCGRAANSKKPLCKPRAIRA